MYFAQSSLGFLENCVWWQENQIESEEGLGSGDISVYDLCTI